MDMREVEARGLEPRYRVELTIGPHVVVADEPQDAGGSDVAPAPKDFLLVALGACTSITVRMYAERKGWPLTGIRVHLEQKAAEGAHEIHRVVHLEGPLTEEQRARLLDIANKCPVHRILAHPIRITTDLAPGAPTPPTEPTPDVT